MKLRHSRVELTLHELTAVKGEPLLLLHALGGQTDDWPAEAITAWPGPVYGLDFAGHGQSAASTGGYYPELYAAEADLVLEHLGDQAALAGAGVGAYVALLLAGASEKSCVVRCAALFSVPGSL